MLLETKHLYLRPCSKNDTISLYKYVKDPAVGPIAGWPVSTDITNSKIIMEKIFSLPEVYTIILKDTNEPVGSIGLMIGRYSKLQLPAHEAELGYWLGRPYWGQGLMPEAILKILHYGFYQLNLENIWCGYFKGNKRSQRVQEKCGFIYHHTYTKVKCALIYDIRTEYISCISKNDWLQNNINEKNL